MQVFKKFRLLISPALFLGFLYFSSLAAASETEPSLFDLPLEQIMQIKVISASRTTNQSLMEAPAAMAVITQEDIRRTGFTSLPEQLRMVPGLHVAQIDGNKWAIASRGLNERYCRTLLVQLDGRTLYSPIFSGVYWEGQAPMLEDLDRIEVVRGPGGALWGANAVNGIINIITKPAAETQGWLMTGTTGNVDHGLGAVRYGGQAGENTFYRVYAKHDERDGSNTYGAPYTDDTGFSQAGFRFDWKDRIDQSLTMQGDFYHGRFSDSYVGADLRSGTNPVSLIGREADGWNFLGKWNKAVSAISDIQVAAYYDYSQHHIYDPVDIFSATKIFDLDCQQTVRYGQGHETVWGLSVRSTHSSIRNNNKIAYHPHSRSLQTFSGFTQGTFSLVPDHLKLILGAKLEHNEFTGFELQPNVRLALTISPRQTAWAAVSRAVRVPSLINEDADFIVTVLARNMAVRLRGNHDMDAERVVAYEAGYRAIPFESLSIDLAVFFNRYNDLKTELATTSRQPTLRYGNEQEGYTQGFEAALDFRPSDIWRIAASYTWQSMHLHDGDTRRAKSTPAHQFQIRSYYDITSWLELNSALYFYDRVAQYAIKSFFRFDAGVTIRPLKNLDISFWGQNLLDPSHKEYAPDIYTSAGGGEVERSFYCKITWRY